MFYQTMDLNIVFHDVKYSYQTIFQRGKMEYKNAIIILILALFIISIAGVSASDVNDTAIAGEDDEPMQVTEEKLETGADASQVSDEKIGETGEGTFTQLQGMINRAGDEPINLTMDYKYDSGFSQAGMVIDRPITINGNGFSIDGLGQSRIFEIKATSGVTLNNITFKNGNTDGNGGAINVWYDFSDSTFKNLKFIDNVARRNGGAVYFLKTSSNILFENVTFENNVANNEDSGAINFYEKVKDVTFYNVTFRKNRAASGVGGAINADDGMENCTFNYTKFIENTAKLSAGALSLNGLITLNTFENTEFINNEAETEDGGAIMIGKWIETSNLENSIFRNVTFTSNTANNNGGALYVKGLTTSNTFNGTRFIYNTAKTQDGGAINFYGKITYTTFTNTLFYKDSAINSVGGAINIDNGMENCLFNKTLFINNTGVYGGALSINNPTSNNNFEDTVFMNNTADVQGGAINFGRWYFTNAEKNTFKRLAFINNNAGTAGALYLYGVSSDNLIRDSIFIKNGQNPIYIPDGELLMSDNWFGNNATDYINGPDMGERVNVQSWLFLNATAAPDEITLDEKSTVAFKLFSYDGNAVSDYGGSLYFRLDLYPALGSLNQTSALTGEKVSYTPYKAGNATITGKFEGACYTVAIKNNRIPTEITIKNATFDMKVDDTVGNIATLSPSDAGPLRYTSSNTSVAVIIGGAILAVGEGNATITVYYEGDSEFAAAENKTINVTVSKYHTEIKLENSTFEMKIDDNVDAGATLEPSNAGRLSYNSTNPDVAYVSSGKIIAVGEGNAVITVSFKGDRKYYAAENKTIMVTVSKYHTEIKLENSTFEMKIDDNVDAGATLEPSNAGRLSYNSTNPDVAYVSSGKIIAVGEGNAVITVSFKGDRKYYAAENKTINVIVSLKDAKVSVLNDTWDLKIGYESKIIAITGPEGLSITYTSGNASVATVDDDGNVRAVGLGSATIILSVGGDGTYAYNSTEVTVNVKAPTEISLQNETFGLKVGDEVPAGATLAPAEAGNLTYTVKDESIVKVDNGKIIALKAGNTTITVSFNGNSRYFAALNRTIQVNVAETRKPTKIESSSVTAVYNIERYLTATLKDDEGNPIAGVKVKVMLSNGKTFELTTDKNGQIKLSTKGLAPKTYDATITFDGDAGYVKSLASAKVTVNKAKPKIVAKKKTYKVKSKTKKFKITLKNNIGKPIKKAKVTIKIKGKKYKKTFKAKTNKNGKATFKIKKLTRKGKYKATITYKGNGYYKKVTKKVKIKIR